MVIASVTLVGICLVAASVGIILGMALYSICVRESVVRLDEVHYVAGEPYKYVLVPAEKD